MQTDSGDREGRGLSDAGPRVWHHGGRVKPRGRRQEGGGRARNRARALLNWFRQGQPCGRGRVRRRALRVMRPAREKKRHRMVLVVAIGSPSPMRVVQRARLWASTCTASQAALTGKRPEGRWLSPTPYLRSLMAFSISAWRRWSASSSRMSPSRSMMKCRFFSLMVYHPLDLRDWGNGTATRRTFVSAGGARPPDPAADDAMATNAELPNSSPVVHFAVPSWRPGLSKEMDRRPRPALR